MHAGTNAAARHPLPKYDPQRRTQGAARRWGAPLRQNSRPCAGAGGVWQTAGPPNMPGHDPPSPASTMHNPNQWLHMAWRCGVWRRRGCGANGPTACRPAAPETATRAPSAGQCGMPTRGLRHSCPEPSVNARCGRLLARCAPGRPSIRAALAKRLPRQSRVMARDRTWCRQATAASGMRRRGILTGRPPVMPAHLGAAKPPVPAGERQKQHF